MNKLHINYTPGVYETFVISNKSCWHFVNPMRIASTRWKTNEKCAFKWKTVPIEYRIVSSADFLLGCTLGGNRCPMRIPCKSWERNEKFSLKRKIVQSEFSIVSWADFVLSYTLGGITASKLGRSVSVEDLE